MEDESFKQRSQDCEEVYHSSSSDGINEDQREAMSTVVQSSEATSNNQTDDESKPRIINTENDYDLMYNLHHLVAVETQFSDDETDLNQYRLGVKRLMQQFLTKFEETLEYQKYLENEVARLNHSDVENVKLKEQVKSMHKELKKVSKERDHMKESRDKELKKLVSFCNNLNSRIQRINNNFEGSEEDEQKYSSRRKSLAKNNRDAKL